MLIRHVRPADLRETEEVQLHAAVQSLVQRDALRLGLTAQVDFCMQAFFTYVRGTAETLAALRQRLANLGIAALCWVRLPTQASTGEIDLWRRYGFQIELRDDDDIP